MLKEMRWRFIGSAMAAITAVVAVLLFVLNIGNYRNITRQQDEALDRLLEIESMDAPFSDGRGAPPFDDWMHFSPEVQYSLRFFSVHCTPDGAIQKINQDYVASVSETDAESYAHAALSSGKMRGYESGYRYLVDTRKEETVVLFLNSERELQTIRSLLFITLAVAGGSLLLVFALVVLFSKRAIAPYLRNLAAQKQFITNASHELKTPLTAISTSADILAMENGENEWVKNIQSQSGRLSKLISSLVTLCRLDEENPLPERTEFSLSDAVWEVAEPFSSLAVAKCKAYTQYIEDGITITGDRTAIGQLVSILLDNAVKYSAAHGVIRLHVCRSGKRAEIEVYNTLPSAGKLDCKRLFERFYRPDASRNANTGGSGVGLSIAKATAEAHGGTIRARQNGKEITFTVRL